MNVKDAIAGRHSVRLYDGRPVGEAELRALADAARLYPCGANLQPLKFMMIHREKSVRIVNDALRWAAYKKDFRQLPEEMPTAFLLLLGDHGIKKDCAFEAGAAVTLLQLAALDMGLQSCCLGIPDRAALAQKLEIDTDRYTLLYAVAVGHSTQRIEAVGQKSDSVEYFTAPDGTWYVPKRELAQVLLEDPAKD